MKFIITLFSAILLTVSALDKPESLVKQHEELKRDLQFNFNANARCERRMSLCETVTAGIGIDERAMEWIEYLQRLDGNPSDPLVTDLYEIVEKSRAAGFSPLVNGLIELSQGERIQSLIRTIRSIIAELTSIDSASEDLEVTLQEVAEATENIYTIIEQTIGGLPAINLDTIILIINFVIRLIQVYNDGPIAILTLVIETVIAFLGTLSIDMLSLSLFPSSDPGCYEELMFCHYTKMMLTTIPALFGGLLLAAGTPTEDTSEPAGL